MKIVMNFIVFAALVSLIAVQLANAMKYSSKERKAIVRTEHKIMDCISKPESNASFCTLYQKKLDEMIRKGKECDATRQKPSWCPTPGSATEESSWMKLQIQIIERMNTRKNVSEVVMDEISCARFIDPIQQRWNLYFASRLDWEHNSNRLMRSEDSVVNEDATSVDVTFRHVKMEHIAGIDLVVTRRSPTDMRESFARYRVSVYRLDSEGRKLEPALYRGFQFSCPTLNDNFMIVPLQDFEDLAMWLSSNNEERVKLRVVVTPEVQVFYEGEGKQGVIVDVVAAVISKDLESYKGIENNGTRRPSSSPFNLNLKRRRRRRSLGNGRKPCRKVSYKLNFKYYAENWNVHYPHVYEIFECEGTCRFPLSGGYNSTNHAIALKTEEIFNNENRPRKATIDCVPVDYDTFYYLKQSEDGVLDSALQKEMVVKTCGCR